MANYEISKNRYVVNPYNHVRVDFGRKTESDSAEKEQTIHAVIHCTGHIMSDLIIPDTAHPTPVANHPEHFHYDLLSLGKDYLIPGSSLRGVLRSNYETITDSCFVTSRKEDRLNARDIGKTAKKPGLLRFNADGKLELYDAVRYCLYTNRKDKPVAGLTLYTPVYSEGYITDKSGNTFSTGDMVSFVKKVIAKDNRSRYFAERILTGSEKNSSAAVGYVVVGENFNVQRKNDRKKENHKFYDSIFVQNRPLASDRFDKESAVEDAFENYLEVLDLYQDEKVNTNIDNDDLTQLRTEWYPGLKKKAEAFRSAGTPDSVFPVWYSIDEKTKKLRMSPGQLSRSVFSTTETEILGSKAMCTDRKHLCPACSLFGMIGNGTDTESNSRGSRVRVTDARISKYDVKTDVRTLEELASPKISYLPFYTNASGKQTYDSGIRFFGRKYYWHHTPQTQNAECTKRNGTYRFICSEGNPEFHFDVFCDGVTDRELRNLLWCISLGQNHMEKKPENGLFCWHIGHAKPLGYGSVKVTADSVEIRNDSWDTEEKKTSEIRRMIEESDVQQLLDEADSGNSRNPELSAAVYDLQSINDFYFENGLDEMTQVSYPYVLDENGNRSTDSRRNEVASHQWFSQSRTEGFRQLREELDIADIYNDNKDIPVIQYRGRNRGAAMQTDGPRKTYSGSGTTGPKPADHKSGPQHAEAVRYTGTVKFFNPEKEFGFIKWEKSFEQFRNDPKKDLNFNIKFSRDLDKSMLKNGSRVSFTISQDKNGIPHANNLKVEQDS